MVGVMWDSVILCIVLRLTSDGSTAYILCEVKYYLLVKAQLLMRQFMNALMTCWMVWNLVDQFLYFY